MNSHYPFVFVGAGIASLSAIKSIREHNQHSKILLISNEDRLPYKRTQINKHIVNGFNHSDFSVNTDEFYTQNNVEIIYNEVVEIDSKLMQITLKSGNQFEYQKLLLATGHKVTLPNLGNIPHHLIFPIYTAAQTEGLLNHLKKGQSYLIIGGGVEGIEIAEQLKKLNKEVLIINRNAHLMHHDLSAEASERLYRLLLTNNVQVLFADAEFLNISYHNQQISFIHNNQAYKADGIIVTTGSKPNIDLAFKANLTCQKGILVNEFFETSQDNIYAAGNVAQLSNDSSCHLWHHAEAQGLCAGLNMAGIKTDYHPKPFRLKTEIFDEFYFSVNVQNITPIHQCIIHENKNIYRELYFADQHLMAVIMINDKERAKIYQKAVWEGWDLVEIDKQLPL